MKKLHLKVMTIVLCTLLVISLVPKDVSAAIPSTPTGLTATLINSNQISLSWDYSGDASYYYVYRSTSYYGSYTLISTVTYPSYLDTNLSSNTTYYYKIQAYNSSGSSAESSIVSITNSFASSDITATAIGGNQINLTWSAVSSVSYYSIYRSNSYYGTYTNIAGSFSANYTDSDLSSGTTYYYKIEAINSSGSTVYYSSVASATTLSGSTYNSPIPTERLSGSNRYETSKAISGSGWDYSHYAVVVSGENYPDALCSAPLAAKHNAPILLTTKNSLDSRTKTELSRLNVRNVFLIGGVNVISSSTERTIRNMGISVTRIAGTDRYDTSLKIAQTLGSSTEAVVAGGENYADALSIAPIAAKKIMPILLTPKNSISSSMRQYLQNNVERTYVVGGTNAISTTVLLQLPSSVRLSGSNRYETNIAIIKKFINELNMETVYLATGKSFPDALAGSALASLSNSPVILVSSPLDQATDEFIEEKRNTMTNVTAFGGTSVISNSLLTSITKSTSSATLSAPIGLTANNHSSNQIYLSWNPVSAATHYYIYRSTSYNGTYSLVTSSTSPWYTDSVVAANITYYYKVKAINNSGSSSYSSIVSATTSLGYLSVPTGLSATAQNSSQIYLSWNFLANADYYYVYRSTSSGSYNYITAVSTTNYPDTGLNPNTTYLYKISAYNSNGTSSYSSVVSAKTAPAAPTLTAVADDTDSITLNWSSVTGASTYVVYTATSSGGPFTSLTNVTAPATTYNHTGLTAGTNYYYKVLAKNSSGLAGDYSSVASVTTEGGVPAVPTNFTATPADGSFEIGLTWTAVSGATSYSISRSTDDATYTEIEADAATNYTDSDAGLLANTLYYYKIKAKNAAGESADSTAAQATTAPAAPDVTVTVDNPNQITLTWPAIDGAVVYKVFRKTDADYEEIATTADPTFINLLLTPDETYYYQVQAINSDEVKSALSAEKSGTTPAI